MKIIILVALLVGCIAHDTGIPHDHPHADKDGKGTRHFGNFGKPLGQHEPKTCATADDCPRGYLCNAQDDQPIGGASMAIVTMPKVCQRPPAASPFYGGLLGSLKGDHKKMDKMGDHHKMMGDHHKMGDHKKGKDPACKAAFEKLCGKCGDDKTCWKKCMTENKAALAKACGKKDGDHWGMHHGHDKDGKHHWPGKLQGVQGTIKACGCTCSCSGFLCSEASKAKGLCSEATQHGITNGEACSKAQGTLNTLAHGLAKLSGCTGTFNTGGGDWTFTPAAPKEEEEKKKDPKPLAGSIGPAWTYDDSVEKPAGEKDMGGWTKRVYTTEQQARLGVDEEGKPVPKAEEKDPKPLIGGGAGSIGPAWTYDETVEKPAGEKDMGGWTARVYTDEQQARLGVDETGAPVSPGAEPALPEENEEPEDKGKGKHHGCWLTKHYRRNRAACLAVGLALCFVVAACCVRCRRRRRARAAMAARRAVTAEGHGVPVGTIVHEGKVVGMVPVAPIPVSSRNTILAKEYLVEMASTAKEQQPAEESGLPVTLGQVVET